MAITVGEIIDQAQRLANRVDPAHRQRTMEGIDRNIVYFSERLPWPSLERKETFYANGTRFFTFPQRVRKLIAVGDVGRKEYIEPGSHWERQHPEYYVGGTDITGGVQWQDRGVVPTIQTPATDVTIRLSTTVSELLTVHLKGLTRDAGVSGTALEFYEITETVTIEGTPKSSNNTYVELFAIEKASVVTTSDVIVEYNTAVRTPAARISKNDRAPSYRRVEFLGVMAAGSAIHTRYYTRPPRITSENVILDPAVDTDFVIWRTVGDLHWIANQAQAAQAAWNKADQLLQAKITAELAHGDKLQQAIPYAPFIDSGPEDIWG